MQFIKALFVLGLTLFSAAAMGQSVGPETIDAAGTSVTVGNVTHEYAIGQVAAGNTFISSTLLVTPDVLQPASPSSVAGQSIGDKELEVYPSPAATTLFLKPDFTGTGVLQYQLFDAGGKLVLSNEARLATGKEFQRIDVAAFASGQYVLQIEWKQGGSVYARGYKVQKLN